MRNVNADFRANRYISTHIQKPQVESKHAYLVKTLYEICHNILTTILSWLNYLAGFVHEISWCKRENWYKSHI